MRLFKRIGFISGALSLMLILYAASLPFAAGLANRYLPEDQLESVVAFYRPVIAVIEASGPKNLAHAYCELVMGFLEDVDQPVGPPVPPAPARRARQIQPQTAKDPVSKSESKT